MKKIIKNLIVIVLFLSVGSFNIPKTYAYFSDTESSTGNTLTAGILDVDISGRNVSGVVLSGNSTTTTITLSKSYPANLDYQYFASTTILDTDQTACNYVTISASSSPQIYSVPLKDFISAVSSPAGSVPWDFTFTVAGTVAPADLGKICNFKISYIAWQTNLLDNSQGFSDVEEMTGSIQIGTAPTVPITPNVVLNEFLPNPGGMQYEHDFGADIDNMPKGEWVELYNNGDTARDLSSWYVRDSLDTSDHKILIDTTHTGLTTQIIGAKGFLVVFMNKALLNNSIGDSVRLFDSNDVLVDSYSYTLPADFCNLKPTEGDTNDENGSGTGTGCTSTMPTNKSYARIPDGTGSWVDPIPTPGEPNKMEEIMPEISGGGSADISIATTTTTTIDLISSTTPEIATTTENVILDNATSSPEVILIPSPDQGEGQGGVLVPEVEDEVVVAEPVIEPEVIVEPVVAEPVVTE